MNAVILTTGKAVRMGHLAPHGCKCLVKVKGKPVLEYQLEVLEPLSEKVTVVCRSEHVELLKEYPVELVVYDQMEGPVLAFKSAHPKGDTILVYGDSLFKEVPDGEDWVGIGFATGPRKWDVIERGDIRSEWTDEYDVRKVCVGIYRFSRPDLLPPAKWVRGEGPVSFDMPLALHHYRGPDLRFKVIPGWADAGTVDAVKTLEAA